MIISHKVPASNTFKSASTYESLCLYKNHLYILNSLGVECQFWKAQVLIYMFGILFFNTLDLSVILQQKKNAKHKDLYMPELALNPK